MSEEIPIGPNRCTSCGGEYGEHDLGCEALERIVTWIAWKSDGRGYLFRGPVKWSMAQACAHAEKIYTDKFVTVQTV